MCNLDTDLTELERDLAAYSPEANQNETAAKYPLPKKELNFLQRWLDLVTCYLNQSGSSDLSPVSTESDSGNGHPTGCGAQDKLITQEEFAEVVIKNAANILSVAYPKGDKRECDHVLFYRVMKDDFSSDAYLQEPKDSIIATRLYRCLKTLFIKSDPLPDATHVILSYHLKRRMQPAQCTSSNSNADIDLKRTQFFASSLLNDFDYGYKTSVLTFNQLDYAVQQLLPDGLIFFGFDKNAECNTDDPVPDFEKPFALFEYSYAPVQEAANLNVTELRYRGYCHTIGATSQSQNIYCLSSFDQNYYSHVFDNFLEPKFPSLEGCSGEAAPLTEPFISLRNRVYQLRFESGQIRSQVDIFDPCELATSDGYDYRLSDERLMSILCYGNDPYYFPAVVFFLDFVNSSRTQDMRYTGGHYDGVRFVDRLLCRMTDCILRYGGFVDKSVYDQLFGIIRLPSSSKKDDQRRGLLRQIIPLFEDLAQIMNEEKELVIATGAASADSYGLRIGASLASVRNVVVGHPLAGIDFTVAGQGVILAARLESFKDETTLALKQDEQPVFSIRLDQNLMYAIFSANFCKDCRAKMSRQLSIQSMWSYWKDQGYIRHHANMSGLGGETVFGVYNAEPRFSGHSGAINLPRSWTHMCCPHSAIRDCP